MERPRCWICFDEPDEAYLAMAALHRYRDGSIDAILIPTDHGPTIDIARDALDDALVRALLSRFGGRIEDAQAHDRRQAAGAASGGSARLADDSPGASQRVHSALI